LVLFAVGFASDPLLGKVHQDGLAAYLAALLCFTTLFGLGTWFLLRYRVEYDEDCVAIHWPNGRCQSLPWSAVAQVEYKKGTGVVVTPITGKAMVIPSILPGADELIRVWLYEPRKGPLAFERPRSG
jgi:hypothetical protein